MDALANEELALLARAVGESLPCELVDRVLEVGDQRAALAQQLGVELGLFELGLFELGLFELGL